MKGGTRKTRKRKLNKIASKKISSSSVSQPATQEAADTSLSDFPNDHPVDMSPPTTPKRTRRQSKQALEVCLTSTPVHDASADVLTNRLLPVNPITPEYCGAVTRQKTLEEVSRKRCKKGRAVLPRKVKQTTPQDQEQISSKKSSPTAKLPRGRKTKTETNILNNSRTTPSSKRTRPRFQLDEQHSAGQGESLMSSDLSIELSPYEEKLPAYSQQEEEEEESEEEEELRSFLQVDKKPPSITQGAFVWYKLRSFPYWPALVKSVNQKQKKAIVLFIDNSICEKKKGFAVPLKSLKSFDCEEADELINQGKEQFAAAISWCLEMVNDYRIRIACGSFSGSFIEYFAHDISRPVRRTYPQKGTEGLAMASEAILLENMDDDDEEEEEEEEGSCTEQEVTDSSSSIRLLPDRTHAALNRANEKLVHFIINQRMVEERLLAVIHGQQKSRWLRYYHSSNNRRRVINPYLEDSKQLDSVYSYLCELHAKAVPAVSRLTKVLPLDRVKFVLDVLLPEAIIHAIAGVENVSVEKAEEKYLKGHQISKRERQEFDTEIERLWLRSQFQTTAPHPLSSTLIS
ncbi:PWWP domain-containing DNA repair factor 3A-like [Gouania willdenowi]|uniref:PWWP domain-containing DNA repair factor 3A-like n=1 Tax=Gouania willdenowi TaxID=441366 RepID=A0A8C5GC33_GOUWI|nr:PWWP domain-containing DNA repair factor 3A-like [Gouania willdenowi]XP_028294065.1 PWWP domain-containing DNA repair factor 3A-like [Gouania willdenowi]